ncbi:MAG: FAD:protein FMN transferase [Gammaproteobacteria bacterium]
MDVLVPLEIRAGMPAPDAVLHQLGGASMGTTWSARVLARAGADELTALLQRELNEVVAQMSHWEPNSVLSLYNGAPAGSWVPLPPEFFTVLAYALDLAHATGGAYDPCAGALVDAWGFGAHGRYNQAGFQPPSHSIPSARAAIELDTAGSRVLQPGGVRLDLSSVAKGFAVDQMARRLEAQGLSHYLVELGGELRGAGVKPDGQPWWVAVEGVPDAATPNKGEARVALHGLALATSGDYRRFFQYGPRRVAHTLDPRTGAPADNQVASVSVLHAECMAADALSTALTVLGPVDGLAFAEQRELAARFLVRAGAGITEVTTRAWRAMLE